uniref:Uncharacterized protein n=1 Tax=Panagrolaimus sp. ES5 TaxID=591445 RepID=A0AC34FE85_9BILA
MQLYREVKKMKNTFNFPNLCSATYHINVHYNEMLLATHRLILTTCPFNILKDLKVLKKKAENLSILEDMGWHPHSNIVNIPDLFNCVEFYLNSIPTFLFNENFYDNNNAHKDYGYYKETEVRDNSSKTNIYIAGSNFKGIKPTASTTIFTMYPNDNDNYKKEYVED